MRYCIHDGCRTLLEEGSYYCDQHRPRKKGRKQNKFQSANKSFYRSDAWKAMREYIYQRDGGTCNECGRFVFGQNAHIHHVIPISKQPELKLDETNLILLCPKCHAKIENQEKQSPPSVFTKFF
ncbi:MULTISPECIES: HNH endonuclease [Bacillus subtilis group]|uniref:HNH endonuclease n=1 Tax=Bacillus subtilis group TaxID=653685 RepID=UPI0009BA84F4|nr:MULTISPECIES: HNH endonuclease signature motif containing protein [Bacillus subtilis group]MCR2018076.1 HNH endonuclease [Bacillus paralicheniformis]PLS10606.1 HNH endonuclease [Bacillus licheniformis]WEZ43941.1 HNH endonuclease signature motif containing protein [Bacillus paralicheniformis]